MEIPGHLQRWKIFIDKLDLTPIEKHLLRNCNFILEGSKLILNLKGDKQMLLTKDAKNRISEALIGNSKGKVNKVVLVVGEGFNVQESVDYYALNYIRTASNADLVNRAMEDENVRNIVREFDGKIVDVQLH